VARFDRGVESFDVHGAFLGARLVALAGEAVDRRGLAALLGGRDGVFVLGLARGEEDLVGRDDLCEDVERVAALPLEVEVVRPLDVALVERVVATGVFGPAHCLELCCADEVFLLTFAECTQHRVGDMPVCLVGVLERDLEVIRQFKAVVSAVGLLKLETHVSADSVVEPCILES